MVPQNSDEGPVQVPLSPGFFIHEPPPIDSVRHPSTIEKESTDFEDNSETGMLCTVLHAGLYVTFPTK